MWCPYDKVWLDNRLARFFAEEARAEAEAWLDDANNSLLDGLFLTAENELELAVAWDRLATILERRSALSRSKL